MAFSRADEEAGAREPFEDAVLYDHEYRRRRGDVLFYRRLVKDRMAFAAPGPVLDLACGTGRILVPLLRDGHTVVGVDRSDQMLDRGARRIARLSPTRRKRSLLIRADLRAFALRPRFSLAFSAFHSIQHLVDDQELTCFFRAVRQSLVPGGWFAFDVLPPDPRWIERDPDRRWARTVLRHPATGERLVYSTNHSYDSRRQALHMRLFYQSLDGQGRPTGRERRVRLCHRQLRPDDIRKLLRRTGFELLASFGGFDGRELPPGDGLPADEHVYVARVRCTTARRKHSVSRR
jgi:SAM-dependent methyltransferase